jgi:hypothetical protein
MSSQTAKFEIVNPFYILQHQWKEKSPAEKIQSWADILKNNRLGQVNPNIRIFNGEPFFVVQSGNVINAIDSAGKGVKIQVSSTLTDGGRGHIETFLPIGKTSEAELSTETIQRIIDHVLGGFFE